MFSHGHGITVFSAVFFCDIAIFSVLNRSVQLDAPFAIIFFYCSHISLRLSHDRVHAFMIGEVGTVQGRPVGTGERRGGLKVGENPERAPE